MKLLDWLRSLLFKSKKRIHIKDIPEANLSFLMKPGIRLRPVSMRFKPIEPCKYWGGYLNHRIIEYTDGTCELQECQNGTWVTKESGSVKEIISRHIHWINGSTGMHKHRELI